MQLLNKCRGFSEVDNSLKKKFILQFTILSFVLVLVVVFTSITAKEAMNFARNELSYVVVIDAGHGIPDGGVTGVNTGVLESELNLFTAKTLAEYFKSAGVKTVLTRKTSRALTSEGSDFKKSDFAERIKIIEKAAPDLVISIHMNSYKPQPSRRGAQVFYDLKNPLSRGLAESIQEKLNRDINNNYGGRAFSALSGDFYIINRSPAPAVIVECGFLSNAEDEKLLADEDFRKELSYVLFSACMGYLFTL
ncbi:MAG: N-acetylmuramoyl-L-alanine amidase [Eubacteriales bacterium]|nr:N-acetylmuramoyl-L-alanine amidase [Christensenellaceae bacterium]MDY2751402.1 N-acetylmuramoyl-L-alanine amidase [Eubacteriales bacterium]